MLYRLRNYEEDQKNAWLGFCYCTYKQNTDEKCWHSGWIHNWISPLVSLSWSSSGWIRRWVTLSHFEISLHKLIFYADNLLLKNIGQCFTPILYQSKTTLELLYMVYRSNKDGFGGSQAFFSSPFHYQHSLLEIIHLKFQYGFSLSNYELKFTGLSIAEWCWALKNIQMN